MSAIERLRYFPGEYLRSSDFQAEQAYHVAMRRRLNVKLHLHGIVEGLQLREDDDSAGSAKFYSIQPGMAIDEQGREIVLEAPYVLTPEIDLARQGLKAGAANVFLCYRESATTPSAAGYGVCNDAAQGTRWREGFEVVVTMQSGSGPMADAGKGCVQIGALILMSVSGALQIQPDTVANVNRTYVGIRAQKIVAPAGDPATFNILGMNARSESIEVEQSAFLDKHLIVGDDFSIVAPFVGTPPTGTLQSGDVKVTNDLFVNGSIYTESAGKWYELKEFILSLTPEIIVGTVDVTPVANQSSDPSFDDVLPKIAFNSKLPTISSVKVITGITSITSRNKTDLATWYQTIVATNPWLIEIDHSSPSISGNHVEVQLKWSVGPQSHPLGVGPPPSILSVASFRVNYVVICYP